MPLPTDNKRGALACSLQLYSHPRTRQHQTLTEIDFDYLLAFLTAPSYTRKRPSPNDMVLPSELQPFGLMDLPAELRNQVFKQVTATRNRQGTQIILDTVKYPMYSKVVGINAATMANKQMSHECRAIAYGQNIFQFTTFCAIVGPSKFVQDPTMGPHATAAVHYGGFELSTNPKLPPTFYNCPGRHSIFGIRLPPLSVCRLIKRLQLVITVHGSSGNLDIESDGDKGTYYDGHTDWLYQLRELSALGFVQLETLLVKTRFSRRMSRIPTYDDDGEVLKAETGLKR
ncbi:hypothetical protein LTR36_004872 [Oleoguttula mirabilis]|uniref:Uncharacterized protein n=1 Tax=Oleoguttula mirabilis TaxID=1507867 RepID=A0AAV9JF12_9PEZI|nr:hypothetical protein LTR36_004872 [Oleoguttula mirabilis]